MDTAGEGGAWGIALLAAYMLDKSGDTSLVDFLTHTVFATEHSVTIEPESKDVAGFLEFMQHYTAGLDIQRAVVDSLN